MKTTPIRNLQDPLGAWVLTISRQVQSNNTHDSKISTSRLPSSHNPTSRAKALEQHCYTSFFLVLMNLVLSIVEDAYVFMGHYIYS